MRTQTLLLGLLAALLLGAGTYWFVTQTEWVDEEQFTPPRGEAARDDFYAATQVLKRLGMQVERQASLDTLPPPQATLWLDSSHWDIFPERTQRLRQWVEQGGHLVVLADQVQEDGPLTQWVPVRRSYPKPDNLPTPAAASAPERAASVPPRLGTYMAREECAPMREPDEVPAAYADSRTLVLCTRTTAVLKTRATPLWALTSPRGTHFLRVAVGAGRVTVMGPMLFRNRDLLREDHGLALAAALAARPGQVLWLVTDEKRTPLLLLVWQVGAPALLLGALALALALWRAGTRFGPPAATPPLARRSVAEQVRGTARFVLNHDPQVLLAAQMRATESEARRHVRRYDQLDLYARAAALARLTALPAAALTQALAAASDRHTARQGHAQALAVLESARRRLEQLPPGALTANDAPPAAPIPAPAPAPSPSSP
jgi:hypothetical protein